MPALPTIASGAIRKLLGGLAAIELDLREVCAAARTVPTVADDPDGRVPIEVLYALWEAVWARRPDPELVLDGARRYVLGDYGLVGFVCASSATLREGLLHVVRYSRLWTDTPVMSFDDGAIELRDHPPVADRIGLRLATESALAELLHGARALTARSDLALASVEIAHPAPADVTAYRAFFGVAPAFGARRTAIVFEAHDLDSPLRGSDQKLGEFLRDLANEALARRGDPDSIVERVRACVAEVLARGAPDVADVARRLAMSERTLRRRLDEEGNGFRAIVDETRSELARVYARDLRLPLAEIAFLLGYAEQSAFQRAFKRWTGQTPAAWRVSSNAAAIGVGSVRRS